MAALAKMVEDSLVSAEIVDGLLVEVWDLARLHLPEVGNVPEPQFVLSQLFSHRGVECVWALGASVHFLEVPLPECRCALCTEFSVLAVQISSQCFPALQCVVWCFWL